MWNHSQWNNPSVNPRGMQLAFHKSEKYEYIHLSSMSTDDNLGKCLPIDSKCYAKGNYFNGVNIENGKFWNIMDPVCNYLPNEVERSISIDNYEHMRKGDRCCVDCRSKVYLDNEGNNDANDDHTINTTYNSPDYAKNWFDQNGLARDMKIGSEIIINKYYILYKNIESMSKKVHSKRRDFLFTTTYAVGAVGIAATIWPLVDQMNPDSSVKALSTTEVDITNVEPGKTITVLWRGKPIFIRRRTKDEIDEAESVDLKDLKDPEKDSDRVKNPEWLVMVGVCTHLGCVPLNGKGEFNAWFCPCHGTHYDTSGRVRKGPAPKNLEIPKYEFVNNNTIKIG